MARPPKRSKRCPGLGANVRYRHKGAETPAGAIDEADRRCIDQLPTREEGTDQDCRRITYPKGRHVPYTGLSVAFISCSLTGVDTCCAIIKGGLARPEAGFGRDPRQTPSLHCQDLARYMAVTDATLLIAPNRYPLSQCTAQSCPRSPHTPTGCMRFVGDHPVPS